MQEQSSTLLYMYVSLYFFQSCSQSRHAKTNKQAVNASNRIRTLARSRSSSLDTLTSSIMSTSQSQTQSPVNTSPEKMGEGSGSGSRKSSLNTLTMPPSSGRQHGHGHGSDEEDDGYVTAEDEGVSGSSTGAGVATPSTARTEHGDSTMIREPPDISSPTASASASASSSSGLKGLMGRMRL